MPLKTAPSADRLEETRQFWNTSPCDGHETYAQRRAWRYAKDPWLRGVIADIASRHGDVVEIGCGQGTDGLTFCQALPKDGHYLGFDYSNESLASARNAVAEAEGLSVTPQFKQGNAEALDREDGSVECVYSLGVLHHSPDTDRSVREVFRVLSPGGTAYVFLYNRWSPKVSAAYLLRGIQHVLDFVLRTDRVLYRTLFGRHLEGVLGTALLEGFGVPVLRSYTRSGMVRLFRGFEIESLQGCGINLPIGSASRQPETLVERRFGLFWFIIARKPTEKE